MEKNSAQSKKRRNDVIFIVAAVLLIGILAGAMLLFREEGAVVEVTVDGKLYGTYSLAVDTTVEIRSGKNGEYYNILVIKGGKAYVSDANCPGVLAHLKCTNQDPISYTGESIICEEHKVVVAVKGGQANDGGLDIIS